MHFKSALFATAVALAVSGPALASYAKGEAAFEAGNYWQARQEVDGPAKAGDPRAQYLLGRMYMEGRGVTQDYIEAHMWLNLATTGGVANARGYRDDLATRMTSQQIAKAQELARAWRPDTGASQSSSQNATIKYSVSNTQQLLNGLGYDAGPVDGAMGGSTRAGIRAYQRANNHYADGRLTEDLFDKIAVSAGYKGNAGGSVATGGSSSGGSKATTIGYSVPNSQMLLNQLGYDAGPVDGAMGNSTRAGIRAYQRANSIYADGSLTQDLFDKIALSAGYNGNMQAGAGGNTNDTGGYSQQIADAQTKLRALDYDVSSVTGHMNAETAAAIREYEADTGMRVSGRVNADLLSRLDADQQNADQRETRMIRRAQRKLDRLGYDAGSADGDMGWKTRNAVRKFQADQGIAVNGQVDRELLDAMNAVLQAKADTGNSNNGGKDDKDADRATVAKIESALNRQGYNAGIEDGRIDDQARAAIRQYQQDWGLSANGRASAELLAHIQDPPSSGSGMSPALVTDIERELDRRGYPVGTIDGRVDGQLRYAVRTWQSDSRVEVNGELDEALLADIRASNVTRAEVSPRAAAGALIQGITGTILENIGKNQKNQGE